MKKGVAILFLLCIFYGCRKDNTPANDLGSFPGALDSIVLYSNSTDSAAYSNGPSQWAYTTHFVYDEQHRVVLIKEKPTAYKVFYYQGNNNLPYLKVDSTIFDFTSPTNYRFYITTHLLTYNNFNKVTVDSVSFFERFRDNALFPEYTTPPHKHVIKYYFQANYSTFTDTRYTPSNYLRDTLFFNATGDILSFNSEGQNSGYGPFQHKVLEYHNLKTPMSELNIAPLYGSGVAEQWIMSPGIFADAALNLYLSAFQPKFLFKKLSGVNPYYYAFNNNDLIEVFFYPKTDANNRITHLVASYYRHKRNTTGTILQTYKHYQNFRFFYHD